MRRVDPEALDRACAAVMAGASARKAALAEGISHPVVLVECARRGVDVRRGSARDTSRPTPREVEARVGAIPEESRKPSKVGAEAAAEFAALPAPVEVVTVEQGATILRCLALGMTMPLAAMRAGVPLARLPEWNAKAEEGREPWASWMTLVTQAQAAGVEELHHIIRSGRPGWQSAGWLLERTRPADYGRRLEVSAAVEAHPLSEVDAETLLAVVRAWESSRA
jgi:hypothetical protein